MMNDLASYSSKLQSPGAMGILPTDTIYGLAARAADAEAVERLYKLKRPEGKPGTVIAANLEQLEELGLKYRYLKAVEQFWPGPISIIIPCPEPALQYLHRGELSLAVRIPADKNLQQLLHATGPLMTSSANYPGEPPATTTQQAHDYFGNKVDFYADGGDLSSHQPSTIIRVIDDAIEIIRPGAVKIDETGRRLS
jgi:L-threonylcarbamoyladenylate synthase